jgi:hypothetical protein
MKKLFIVVLLIILLPIIAFAGYILEDSYYQAMSYKAKKAANIYLEEKYEERFNIEKINYSKALGDEEGIYDLYAHPINQPDISFRLYSNENYEISYDDYKEMKWRNDVIKEYKEIVKSYFPNHADLYVNTTFQKDVVRKYDIKDTYTKIFTENPNQRDEYVHILLFTNKKFFDYRVESTKIFQLWTDIIGRSVKDYTIEVKYFPVELEEKYKTYSSKGDFEGENWKESFYTCRFSSSDVQKSPIKNIDDITKLCRQ